MSTKRSILLVALLEARRLGHDGSNVAMSEHVNAAIQRPQPLHTNPSPAARHHPIFTPVAPEEQPQRLNAAGQGNLPTSGLGRTAFLDTESGYSCARWSL